MLQFALGVDYGAEFHKSSMIIPGKYFYMVENQISKKKSPTSLAFCSGDRLFENQALKKFVKKNCDSFSYPTRFLYKKHDDDDFKHELFLDDHKMVKDDIGYMFEVKKSNLPQVFNFTRNSTDDESYLIRTEEVNAMILENNLINAGKTGDTVFKEGVVTIPSNDLSIEARKRIKATNELAGFKVLGLVHENTAAALYYAIDRPSVPENILFVNVGSAGTKLSLVSYRNDNITSKANVTETLPSVVVIDDIYSDKVSGHVIDDCMGEYALHKYLANKPNRDNLLEQVDLYKRRRIISDIKRPKEILSVNRESNLTMEDFFGNMPLTTQVVKAEFEERCQNIIENLEQILEDFEKRLATHDMSKIDINAIEIIGGSTRVPLVQEKLKDFYSLKLNTRINGDDGPALGATFLAGNYTVGVRTKRILLTDGPNYPVFISVKFDNQTEVYKEVELFHRKTRYGTKKSLTVKSLNSNTHIRMFTNDTDSYFKDYLVKEFDTILDNYKDKNVTEWKAVFSFEMDTLGIPGLKHAELIIKENVTETVNVTIAKNTTNATNGTEKEIRQEVRNYNRTNKEKLSIQVEDESYKSLLDNKKEFNLSKKLLKDLREHEEHKRTLSMLRNTLESYIYKLKTIADADEHKIYLSEEERSGYRAKSDEIDDFFMSEHLSTAGLHDLKNRTKEIESFMYLYEHRKAEHKNRNAVYTKSLESLNKTAESLDSIQKLRTWIPIEKIEEVKEQIQKAEKEIVKAYEDQIATPLHINPTFTYNFVTEKIDDLQRLMSKLRLIEKPKKPSNKMEDLDDMIKKMGSFNSTDPNFDLEKMKELLENMKKYNITTDELLKNAGQPEDLINEEAGERQQGTDDDRTEREGPDATEGDSSDVNDNGTEENDMGSDNSGDVDDTDNGVDRDEQDNEGTSDERGRLGDQGVNVVDDMDEIPQDL